MNKNSLIKELQDAEYTHDAIMTYIYHTLLKRYEENKNRITYYSIDPINHDYIPEIEKYNKKILEIIKTIEVSEDYTKCFNLIADLKEDLIQDLTRC